jgi:hypothetical protein
MVGINTMQKKKGEEDKGKKEKYLRRMRGYK